MHDTDRSQILHEFQKSREELLAALADIVPERAGWAPEGRWSAVQIVEHIAITEEALLQLGLRAVAGRPMPNPIREAKIVGKGLDRSRFISVPDGASPPEGLTDLALALDRFERARAATLAWVNNYEGDPRAAFTTHPMVQGPVNCYEMMLLIAIHSRRHAAQIRQLCAPQSVIDAPPPAP